MSIYDRLMPDKNSANSTEFNQKMNFPLSSRTDPSINLTRRPFPYFADVAPNDKWRLHVRSARKTWGKLSTEELLKSKGHPDRLSGLISERYAITRERAERQVKFFLEGRNL